jgi:DNA-binding winged helix-turn-helix (wHTH) protein
MATDTDWINGSSEALILFGPFRLLPKQRLLMCGDKSVHLGGRAFDVLIALLERPGELISKEEIIARVWPNRFVGPANLAVHISSLRRALEDGRDGNRYLVNVPGRGYRFVAPVTVVEDPKPAAPEIDQKAWVPLAQSAEGSAMVEKFAARLPEGCFLAIARASGSDGTGFRLALVQEMAELGRNDVWLVDLKMPGGS